MRNTKVMASREVMVILKYKVENAAFAWNKTQINNKPWEVKR